MKIVHVVTYVSEDGAFGGPVAVALAHLKELAKQGHDVELLAGWDGKATVVAPGVKVTLFRVHRLWLTGFSGLRAPGLSKTLRSRAKSGAVVHIHFARDLVTLPAALAVRSYTKPVIQTHGMVMPDGRVVARLLDCIVTRQILRSARCVLALTETEEVGLRQVASGHVVIERIANGVRIPAPFKTVRREGEVLFLARLHPRKRVMAFAEMSKLLHARGANVRCVVVGPDEGDLPPLLEFVRNNSLEKALVYEGVLPSGQAVRRLSEAEVFVLPSTGEVFPMTVLESLAAGTPVVTTSDSGIAKQLVLLESAIITQGTPIDLADAVQKILVDKNLSERLISNGYRALDTSFNITAVSSHLLNIYNSQG